jgi:hypothetical protein
MKKVVKTIFLILIILPFYTFSQREYDKKIIGTWIGTISSGGLATKNITIVITKSNYNFDLNKGTCEGYSIVNNGTKTIFIGEIIIEADMPIIEVKEPKTNSKNGQFHLEFGCFTDKGIDNELCCGNWISYDKSLNRNIEVRKK